VSDVRRFIAALGVDEADLDVAEANGTLLALAAERFLLPGERTLTAREVASEVGITLDELNKLWLALGFPQPLPDEKALSTGDVKVLETLFADGTTVSDYTLHEARVISASLTRIAEVFTDEMWDKNFSAGETQTQALGQIGTSIDVDRIEWLLLHLLRAQIVAAIYRRSALHDRAQREGQPSLAIGFADIAGYTTMSQSLDARELTRLVVSFEQRTYDLAAKMGGRVVKTIGDEVMFVFEEPGIAATFALELGAQPSRDQPALRVGLGWGPVLVRQGDCFGPTVNLASRVVNVASAGEVVVEGRMRAQLATVGFETTAMGSSELKGFGNVELWRLETQRR